MARESSTSRDSLSEFFKAGWKSKAVRGALVTCILAAGGLIGNAARWAMSEPWKPDTRLTEQHVQDALARAVSNDTRLQNSELSLWKAVVQLDAQLYCPRQTPVARQGCAGVALKGFEFMLSDTSVHPQRTPAQAAAETIKQIEAGTLLQ